MLYCRIAGPIEEAILRNCILHCSRRMLPQIGELCWRTLNFLSNRTQKVLMNGENSDPINVISV